MLVENRTTPLELSMHRFVDFEKGSDFIGRAALLQEREQGSKRKMSESRSIGAPSLRCTPTQPCPPR